MFLAPVQTLCKPNLFAEGCSWLPQVLNDLKWNVVRPQGLEAVMRVRCSQVSTALQRELLAA